MQSIELLHENLVKSRDRVLARIEDMRGHAMTFPTPHGGCHTLWVLGHLAYIESLVIHSFVLGEANPLTHWEEVFDGADVSGDPNSFPSFDEALAQCHTTREATLALLATLTEADLDRPSARIQAGFEDTFGTYRRCFQFVADHGYMHRGHLADARRAAGLGRIWV